MDTFRRAGLGDMDDIMRLIREAQAFIKTLGIDQWQDGYPERGTLEADIDLGQLYVFAEEESVHAVAALTLLPEPIYDAIEGAWLTDGPYLTIHRMAIDDSRRGRGLAAGMLERALRMARENGCAAVRADTHRGNRVMRRFLEKNGFRCCGLVRYDVKEGDPLRVAYEKLI